MVGVSVRAVGSERHDDVGTSSPQMLGNACDDLTRVRAVEMLVVVVEQGDFANAEHRSGSAQLGLTDARERRPGRDAEDRRDGWPR